MADRRTSTIGDILELLPAERLTDECHIGPALDEVLRIASEMELIEQSERDPGAGVVTISLSACETEMREGEALVFLAECIFHKLNELRRMPALEAKDSTRGAGSRASAVCRPPH